jgi:hypothetical protein
VHCRADGGGQELDRKERESGSENKVVAHAANDMADYIREGGGRESVR